MYILDGVYGQNSGKEGNWGEGDVDALALSRRLKALQIPPLCHDLGSLQQPDGRPYRLVNDILFFCVLCPANLFLFFLT